MSNLAQPKIQISGGAIAMAINSCAAINHRKDESITSADNMAKRAVKASSQALSAAIARHHPERITQLRKAEAR